MSAGETPTRLPSALAADDAILPFAVETRLVKLGKLPPRVGRFGAPAA